MYTERFDGWLIGWYFFIYFPLLYSWQSKIWTSVQIICVADLDLFICFCVNFCHPFWFVVFSWFSGFVYIYPFAGIKSYLTILESGFWTSNILPLIHITTIPYPCLSPTSFVFIEHRKKLRIYRFYSKKNPLIFRHSKQK